HAGGHAQRESGALQRAHATRQPELEDGRGDHRAAPDARPRRSGQIRLRALPQAHVGAMSQPPRRARLRALWTPARVPSLAREAVMTDWSAAAILAHAAEGAAAVVAVTGLLLWRLTGGLNAMEAARRLPDQSLLLLQREIETARAETRHAQSETLASVRQELQHFTSQMASQMGQVGSGVQQQL